MAVKRNDMNHLDKARLKLEEARQEIINHLDGIQDIDSKKVPYIYYCLSVMRKIKNDL